MWTPVYNYVGYLHCRIILYKRALGCVSSVEPLFGRNYNIPKVLEVNSLLMYQNLQIDALGKRKSTETLKNHRKTRIFLERAENLLCKTWIYDS